MIFACPTYGVHMKLFYCAMRSTLNKQDKFQYTIPYLNTKFFVLKYKLFIFMHNRVRGCLIILNSQGKKRAFLLRASCIIELYGYHKIVKVSDGYS